MPSTVRPSFLLLLAGRPRVYCAIIHNPCWLAGRTFSVLAGDCQFGTAWVGLRVIHHHQQQSEFTIRERKRQKPTHHTPKVEVPSSVFFVITFFKRISHAAADSGVGFSCQ